MNALLAIDWLLLIEKLVLIAIIVFASLGIALYTTFAERKVAAVLQDRPGPNRAGPFGLLQPFALFPKQTGKMFGINDIRIFPNPAHSSFYIANSHPGDTVILANLNGSIMSSTTAASRIDISGLLPGLYLVKIAGPHITTVSKLLVR